MKYHALAASACIAACFFAAPLHALAHVMPVQESPRVDATITPAPSVVKIWFDEGLDPKGCSLSVKNAAGDVVSLGEGKVTGDHSKLLEVDLKQLLPGTYHVFWKALSVDGHHTEGDYRFTVGETP